MFRYAHHLTVKRLRFRPVLEQNNKTLQLASGGADHSVKIYNIQIDTITLAIKIILPYFSVMFILRPLHLHVVFQRKR
jgi:hypothetical protein